jgi:hypothetical protein
MPNTPRIYIFCRRVRPHQPHDGEQRRLPMPWGHLPALLYHSCKVYAEREGRPQAKPSLVNVDFLRCWFRRVAVAGGDSVTLFRTPWFSMVLLACLGFLVNIFAPCGSLIKAEGRTPGAGAGIRRIHPDAH